MLFSGEYNSVCKYLFYTLYACLIAVSGNQMREDAVVQKIPGLGGRGWGANAQMGQRLGMVCVFVFGGGGECSGGENACVWGEGGGKQMHCWYKSRRSVCVWRGGGGVSGKVRAGHRSKCIETRVRNGGTASAAHVSPHIF